MKQLTGLDATFLYMETPNSFGHVNGLAVYRRPDDPDYKPYEAFKAQIESRLHLLDPFRRRLVEVPLGLDHPYWINDPDFDIDFHVRHIAIPPPGDREQLAAQVARIIGRPMDRTKPLWEAYVMEGLEGDEYAVLTKIHHATVDGASGVELLTILLDTDPAGDAVPADDGEWTPDSIPTDLELLSRTVGSFVRRPARLARVQLNAIQQMAEITRNKGLETLVANARQQVPALRRLRSEEQPLTPTGTAPRTPFNRSITPHRRLAIRSVALSDIKKLKTKADATVNDVVMTMCAGALRNYLQHHDSLPDVPLQAMVPVSIRTGDEEDRWTNRVSSLIAALPTHIDDPLERLEMTRAAMVAAKEQFELVPADALVDLANFSSPALAAQAARVATSLRIADQANPPVNVVISNVPGPRQPLFVAGAELQHYYPVSTIGEGIGLNITVHSYLDTLDIGLVSCRELVPDLEYLVELHVDEIEVLFKALKIKRKKPA
ncbi:MAG: wax ester/triacylglycerol synthase family O-acyltransferase [Acidimicrobiia bacterium]|nr:wax ester/triacylglycerol synthase family O-acyltransferase [Acidimicrobiia bacterium]